jgi:hypothetical protein
MKPPSEVTLIVGDGEITALAGGPISLADMGERKTKRVSTLEFSSIDNQWHVFDAATGADLYSHHDYDVALAWEIAHFNRVLETVET